MKPDMRNIDEVVHRYLPSASEEQVDLGGARVLRELRASGGALNELVVDSNPARLFAWRRVVIASAMAAVLLAVFMGMIVMRRHGAPAVVENVDGGLYRVAEGKAQILRVNESVKMGEVIHSNGGSGGTLLLADGSRVEMGAQAELSLEAATDGVRLRLKSGSIIVNAAKQRTGHLYVETRDVLVSVVGTVFLVNAEEGGSRVAVIQGEVRVQQGTTEKTLLPGEQVATSSLMKEQPMSKEFAWSRNAEEHLALLEQAGQGAVNPVAETAAFEVASVRPRSSAAGGGGGRGGGGAAPPSCGGSPATLDPGRFVVTNATLYRLITMAYGLDCSSLEVSEFELLSGGPDWIRSEKFDIDAIIPQGSPSYTLQQLSLGNAPKLQLMIQAMLKDRFKLVLRSEMKELPVYLLRQGKGAPKLTAWKEGDGTRYAVNTGLNADGLISTAVGGKKQSMAGLAQQLVLVTRRPVLDRTGITGEFSYSLEFAPSDDQIGVREMRANNRFPFLTGPSLATALEEQLGLRLEATKATVEVRVIDSANRPTEN